MANQPHAGGDWTTVCGQTKAATGSHGRQINIATMKTTTQDVIGMAVTAAQQL